MRPEFAYRVTPSALNTKLVLARKGIRVNCAKPCLRREFAYSITLSALHTKLILGHQMSPPLLFHNTPQG